MAKPSTWGLIVLYIILVIIDLLLNLAAALIPSLGSIAEGVTELIIEFASAIIVIMIARNR